jgi:hypothetical protein
MSHDPGPWVLDETNTLISVRGYWVTRDISGERIRMDGSTGMAFHRLENARLITASPEMHEALDFVLHDKSSTIGGIAKDKIVAALAKAKYGDKLSSKGKIK